MRRRCLVGIPQLLDDIDRALHANAQFSALYLTLGLVAECAELEYPDNWFDEHAQNDEYLQKYCPRKFKVVKDSENKDVIRYIGGNNHDAERFIMWVNDLENAHNCNDVIKEQMEKFQKNITDFRRNPDGRLTPHLDGELLYKIRCKLFHEASIDIDFLELQDVGNKEITDLLLEILHPNKFAGGISTGIDDRTDKDVSVRISVNYLVSYLTHLVKLYYDRNSDKKFNEIPVVDDTGCY